MIKNNNYSYKIENINFILIFLVVILHSSPASYANNNSVIQFTLKLINVICDCAVPTFFTISSYLFFLNYDYNQYPIKLKKRVKSLAIPYILWSCLLFIYYLIMNYIPIIKDLIHENTISLSFWSNIRDILLCAYDKPLWFIRVLLEYAIISPIILALIKFSNKHKLFLLIDYVGLLCIPLFLYSNYTSITFWLPCLFIGSYLGYKKNIFPIKKNKSLNLLTIFIIIVLVFTSNCVGEKNMIYYIYRILSPSFILYLFNTPFIDKKIFSNLNSFFIFCIHFPIAQVYRKICIKLFFINEYSLIAIHILTIIFTILTIYIITIILKKYFNKIYTILCGNRLKKENYYETRTIDNSAQ